MAFEIVDGMTGTKHISSDDLSELNDALVGGGYHVWDYANAFWLTMSSANKATISSGVGMVDGKRFWNSGAVAVTVDSGTQGQKRNDLVVARYSRTSAGIESVEPVVIKGTPTAGTPSDPEVTTKDLKLWRIPIDGLNAGTPIKLFRPLPGISDLADANRSVIKSARVGNGGMLTLECAADGSWISLRGNAFWSKHSDAWASMVQIPGYANGSDWYIDTRRRSASTAWAGNARLTLCSRCTSTTWFSSSRPAERSTSANGARTRGRCNSSQSRTEAACRWTSATRTKPTGNQETPGGQRQRADPPGVFFLRGEGAISHLPPA